MAGSTHDFYQQLAIWMRDLLWEYTPFSHLPLVQKHMAQVVAQEVVA